MGRIVVHQPPATPQALAAITSGFAQEILSSRRRKQEQDDRRSLMGEQEGIQTRRMMLGDEMNAARDDRRFDAQAGLQAQRDSESFNRSQFAAEAQGQRQERSLLQQFEMMHARDNLNAARDDRRFDAQAGRAAEQNAAKQFDSAQRGEAAVQLYQATNPAALYQGPPDAEQSRQDNSRSAIEGYLRLNPDAIDDPFVRQLTRMPTPSEATRENQQGRLRKQVDQTDDRTNWSKAVRGLLEQTKKVSRLQAELARSPESMDPNNPNTRRNELLTALKDAEARLTAMEVQYAPFTEPRAPGMGGMGAEMQEPGPAGGMLIMGPNGKPMGDAGRSADGSIMLAMPSGRTVPLNEAEYSEVWRRTAARFGPKWAEMSSQEKRAAMAEWLDHYSTTMNQAGGG